MPNVDPPAGRVPATPSACRVALEIDGWRADETTGHYRHPDAPPGERIRHALIEEHPAKALEYARRLVPSPRRRRG